MAKESLFEKIINDDEDKRQSIVRWLRPNPQPFESDSKEVSSNKIETIKAMLAKINRCMKKPQSGTLRVWTRNVVLILLMLMLAEQRFKINQK